MTYEDLVESLEQRMAASELKVGMHVHLKERPAAAGRPYVRARNAVVLVIEGDYLRVKAWHGPKTREELVRRSDVDWHAEKL